MTRRILIAAGIALVVGIPLLVACGARSAPTATSARSVPSSASIPASPSPFPQSGATSVPPAGGIVWNAPPDTVAGAQENDLENAVAALPANRMLPADTYLAVTGVRIDGDWAVLRGEERSTTASGDQRTGAITYLARREASSWHITADRDPDFCRVLQQAPDTLISKDYFMALR